MVGIRALMSRFYILSKVSGAVTRLRWEFVDGSYNASACAGMKYNGRFDVWAAKGKTRPAQGLSGRIVGLL